VKKRKKKKKKKYVKPPRNLIVPLMHLHTKPGPHKVKKKQEKLEDWELEY
jgi:hypothetical protein